MGLLVTLIQLFLTVFLLAPEGPFSFRYQSLVQHDGYWFVNILERGYQTTVPPINHKVMEVSNVAFFPAYPALAAVVRSIFRVETETALVIAAQLAGKEGRILGIDTPETKKPGYTVVIWGPEASEFAKSTLLGQRVAFVSNMS